LKEVLSLKMRQKKCTGLLYWTTMYLWRQSRLAYTCNFDKQMIPKRCLCSVAKF